MLSTKIAKKPCSFCEIQRQISALLKNECFYRHFSNMTFDVFQLGKICIADTRTSQCGRKGRRRPQTQSSHRKRAHFIKENRPLKKPFRHKHQTQHRHHSNSTRFFFTIHQKPQSHKRHTHPMNRLLSTHRSRLRHVCKTRTTAHRHPQKQTQKGFRAPTTHHPPPTAPAPLCPALWGVI